MTPRTTLRDYAEGWERSEDHAQIGQHTAEELRSKVWPWLLDRGYATGSDDIDGFIRVLGRRPAHLRPGMEVTRLWDRAEADRLDDQGEALVLGVREALVTVLGMLDEPQLRPAGAMAGS